MHGRLIQPPSRACLASVLEAPVSSEQDVLYGSLLDSATAEQRSRRVAAERGLLHNTGLQYWGALTLGTGGPSYDSGSTAPLGPGS